jgi:hypothetical protein
MIIVKIEECPLDRMKEEWKETFVVNLSLVDDPYYPPTRI